MASRPKASPVKQTARNEFAHVEAVDDRQRWPTFDASVEEATAGWRATSTKVSEHLCQPKLNEDNTSSDTSHGLNPALVTQLISQMGAKHV